MRFAMLENLCNHHVDGYTNERLNFLFKKVLLQEISYGIGGGFHKYVLSADRRAHFYRARLRSSPIFLPPPSNSLSFFLGNAVGRCRLRRRRRRHLVDEDSFIDKHQIESNIFT